MLDFGAHWLHFVAMRALAFDELEELWLVPLEMAVAELADVKVLRGLVEAVQLRKGGEDGGTIGPR